MVSNGFKALLGAPSILQFSLTSVNVDNIMLVSGDTPNWSSVLADHKDVYAGEGKLKEKLHLNVDKTFLPVFLPVRKVPLAVKEPLKKEIDRLVAVVDSSLFYIRTTLQFGMSANFLQLSGKFDFAIASFNTPLKKYCQALFSICKGSTWAWSINLPIKGKNSWRLFFQAMKSVTLLRNCFSLSCFSDKDF